MRPKPTKGCRASEEEEEIFSHIIQQKFGPVYDVKQILGTRIMGTPLCHNIHSLYFTLFT
jgi:hypothetical protein